MSRLQLVERLCGITAGMSASNVAELRAVCQELRYSDDQPRDEHGKWISVGLMHGTTYESAQDILKEGFKPGEANRVFATPSRKIALAYGFGKLVRKNEPETKDAKFAVVVFKGIPRGFKNDPDSPEDTWQWSKQGSVPPEDIERVEVYSAWDHSNPIEILHRSMYDQLFAVCPIEVKK